MPNGQGGEGWFERGSIEQQQRRREADYARGLIERNHYTIQPSQTVHVEQGTYTASNTVTTSGRWLNPSIISFYSPPPKPTRRPTRPVSAIFYPMVNECGY